MLTGTLILETSFKLDVQTIVLHDKNSISCYIIFMNTLAEMGEACITLHVNLKNNQHQHPLTRELTGNMSRG